MKIRKLIIKNYKVFDDVEFDFTDLEGNTVDTVVLAGVNGCGKTTVLELIKYVFSGIFLNKIEKKSEIVIEFDLPKKEIELIESRIPREISSTGESIWMPNLLRKIQQNDWLFSNKSEYDTSLQYLISVFHSIPVNNNAVTYFPVIEQWETPDVQLPEEVKIFKMELHSMDMEKIALKHIRDEIFRNKNNPPKETIEHQIQHITRGLKDMNLNTRLVDLESEELVFESINGRRIYFDQLSHGEQHLYFRAIYLSQLNIKNGIIMIDEPEAAFHPTWQQKIAQLYRNAGENNQVFMATHSPHIMASVPPECLFILHIDESTRKIQVINAAKAGKHSQGLEPHRILKEIMQVDILRDYETQRDIEHLAGLLTPDDFETPEAEKLTEKLTAQLGRQDPFIIRLEHQLLMLRRKKENLAPTA